MSKCFLEILGVGLILLSVNAFAATANQDSSPWHLHIINDTGHPISIYVNDFACVHPKVVDKLSNQPLGTGDSLLIKEPWLKDCPGNEHHLQVCTNQDNPECHFAYPDDLGSRYMKFSEKK